MRRSATRLTPRPVDIRRHARPLATIAVLAVVSALAAGCNGGGDADDDDDAPIVALTTDQIAEAVLQPANLGEGWTSEPSTEDDNEAPGCLADLEKLIGQLEHQDRGGTELTYGDILTVRSTVTTYPDETALKSVFEQVRTVAAACTDVTGQDSDGNQWDLTLAVDDSATYDDVDDQYSLSGSGTITTPDGAEIEIHVEQTAVRLGPNVASISTSDFESRTTEHAAWAEIAVERFVDVAEGEEPEATTAPAPGPAA